MKIFGGILVLSLVVASGVAYGQKAKGPRAEELRRVPELVCSDPDDQKRIEHLEAIVAANDPVKLLIAIRCAIASDEPVLRSVGLRAYLATLPLLQLDIAIDPKLMQQYENKTDRRVLREIDQRHPYLRTIRASGQSLGLKVAQFDFATGIGRIDSGRPAGVPIDVKSDKLAFAGHFATTVIACNYEIRPTQDYKLQGLLRCRGWPPLKMTGEMF